MSIRLPPTDELSNIDDSVTESSESDESDDDQNWDDWASDSLSKTPCRSLFDENVLPSAEEAMKHDKEAHGYDLSEVCSRLGLYLVTIFASC
jgi:type I protein arginine methyltransferase